MDVNRKYFSFSPLNKHQKLSSFLITAPAIDQKKPHKREASILNRVIFITY